MGGRKVAVVLDDFTEHCFGIREAAVVSQRLCNAESKAMIVRVSFDERFDRFRGEVSLGGVRQCDQHRDVECAIADNRFIMLGHQVGSTRLAKQAEQNAAQFVVVRFGVHRLGEQFDGGIHLAYFQQRANSHLDARSRLETRSCGSFSEQLCGFTTVTTGRRRGRRRSESLDHSATRPASHARVAGRLGFGTHGEQRQRNRRLAGAAFWEPPADRDRPNIRRRLRAVGPERVNVRISNRKFDPYVR